MNRLIREIRQVNNLSKSINILNQYNSNDWKKHIEFCNKNYKKNLFYRDQYFEMFIVCWNPFQETKIHNHSNKGCILKVLEGSINEKLYDINFNLINECELEKNKIRYIDNTLGIHKMINGEKRCISLHIYSPPDQQFLNNKIIYTI